MTFFTSDIIANGIRLRYYRTSPDGDGKPPVVLCHGYSDNALCWTALARELAPDYDVIMADARCHGDSEAPASGNGPHAMAADLKAFIKVLDLDQPVCAGHSMGASQVFLAASKYPGLMRAAILEDPVWIDGVRPGPRPDRRAALAEQMAKSYEELLAENVALHPTWDQETLELFATAKRQLDDRVHDAPIVDDKGWREYLGAITCPVLVYTGDPTLGAIISDDVAQAALARCDHLTHEHISGVGHHIRYEGPELYTAAFKRYLAEIYGA